MAGAAEIKPAKPIYLNERCGDEMKWWARQDSDLRPPACEAAQGICARHESIALPRCNQLIAEFPPAHFYALIQLFLGWHPQRVPQGRRRGHASYPTRWRRALPNPRPCLMNTRVPVLNKLRVHQFPGSAHCLLSLYVDSINVDNYDCP